MHSFGRWRFDANTGDLLDGATTTRLEPQVAKLLDYFLRNQNVLVSRDEVMAAVWDNRIVSDDAINRCISILRQTLTPGDKNAFIETIVRRGYMSHFPPPQVEPAAVDRRSRHAGLRILGSIAVFIAVVTFAAVQWFSNPSSQSAEVRSDGLPVVAVLPFSSASPAEDSEFFANGMHDDLLTQLAQLQTLRVISRTSVLGYRNSTRNVREIGAELGADAVLEGGVQRVGDQIRINVQLIDAHSDGHLWAQQYDRELSPANIFAVQSEIARAIASSLQATLSEQDAAQMQVLPTENMAAYRAYHEAIEMRNSTSIGDPAYIEALERAVSLDPNFVRAWTELAGSFAYLNLERQDAELVAHMEEILERIRLLAPQSAEYLIAQGYFTYYVLKDYPRAFELVHRAQELRPSDPRVLELQGWIQRRLGDIDGRIDSLRLAQTLDPRNPHWTVNLVWGLIVTHRYDDAAEAVRNAPVDNDELSLLRITLQLRDQRDFGRHLEALEELQMEYGIKLDPFVLWAAHIASRDYEGAATVLDSAGTVNLSFDYWAALPPPGIDMARIITYGFLDASDRAAPLLVEARARLEGEPDSEPEDWKSNRYLGLAFIAAAEHNREEAERMVRAWQRMASKDLAQLAQMRHFACRALGSAAAASAAIECIRSALAEPSQAMPFAEPYLPYYDSIRNQPEFVGMLADIEAH